MGICGIVGMCECLDVCGRTCVDICDWSNMGICECGCVDICDCAHVDLCDCVFVSVCVWVNVDSGLGVFCLVRSQENGHFWTFPSPPMQTCA